MLGSYSNNVCTQISSLPTRKSFWIFQRNMGNFQDAECLTINVNSLQSFRENLWLVPFLWHVSGDSRHIWQIYGSFPSWLCWQNIKERGNIIHTKNVIFAKTWYMHLGLGLTDDVTNQYRRIFRNLSRGGVLWSFSTQIIILHIFGIINGLLDHKSLIPKDFSLQLLNFLEIASETRIDDHEGCWGWDSRCGIFLPCKHER